MQKIRKINFCLTRFFFESFHAKFSEISLKKGVFPDHIKERLKSVQSEQFEKKSIQSVQSVQELGL